MTSPLSLLASLLLTTAPALAQQPSPEEMPGGQETEKLRRPQEPKERQEKPKPGIQVEPRPELEVPDEGKKIKVNRFNVTGASAVSAERIREIVAEYEGRELDIKSIKGVAALITKEYRDRGFLLALAYVPRQEIRGGVVEIAVLEGKIDKVLVSGNTHYPSDLILDYLAPLHGEPVLQQETLERSLVLLNDFPQLATRATLRPAEKLGYTDLYIDAVDRRPYWASFDYDNFGSKNVSENRFGATLGLGNLFDTGHWMTLRGVVGTPFDDMSFFRFQYNAPLGADGFRLTAAYSRSDYRAGGSIANLDPTGIGNIWEIAVQYPFIRDRNQTLQIEGGVEWKDMIQELNGVETSNDRLRIVYATLYFECTDPWSGRNILSLGIRQGIPNVFGGMSKEDEDASRLDAGGEFTKYVFSLHRFQKLADWLHLIGRFTLQWVDWADPLVVSEMLGIGGHDSVRGYPSYEFNGDRGYNVSFEGRIIPPLIRKIKDPFSDTSGYTLADMIQIVIFYDHAEAMRVREQLGEDDLEVLSGWGIGARVTYPGVLSFRFDIGWPATGSPESSDGRIPWLYFRAEIFLN